MHSAPVSQLNFESNPSWFQGILLSLITAMNVILLRIQLRPVQTPELKHSNESCPPAQESHLLFDSTYIDCQTVWRKWSWRRYSDRWWAFHFFSWCKQVHINTYANSFCLFFLYIFLLSNTYLKYLRSPHPPAPHLQAEEVTWHVSVISSASGPQDIWERINTQC